MSKDKKKPKEDRSMKGALHNQKKEKAPAVDRCRSVASARSRVDEDSGSIEHGSRPHTSGTLGWASVDPVSASSVRQRIGDSFKDSTRLGVRVIRMSDKPDIQDSTGFLEPRIRLWDVGILWVLLGEWHPTTPVQPPLTGLIRWGKLWWDCYKILCINWKVS